MIIDVQRFRDASMAWLRVSDLLLLTPGWSTSVGCQQGHSVWLKRDDVSFPYDLERRPQEDLRDWIKHEARSLRRAPRVYVAGPYLTGVDGPYDEGLFYSSLRLAVYGSQTHEDAIPAQVLRLSANILRGIDWCKRVLDAGGYPYCPWADALLVIASPSEEATS